MTLPKGRLRAAAHVGIVRGHCVVFDDEDQLTYAGPVRSGIFQDGGFVFLHPEDFASLEAIASRHEASNDATIQ